ncbi:glycosyltransferase [Parvularcula dongshanensis]|uniref:Glycosyltransferase involved in cell wall biosynthesis n=1 Tax=Parvularcula dongshanensis TaxID=1173995 RepID=A0A840I5U1_9PROT|nr:glycosyltransferase [Parvularcula dongshanensis]MBB4660177.1 glycosyltransferase involved in cell wall biosynthesis [Parvularcula dongshanensis]
MNEPIITVVLEGYNQSRALGDADDTLAALAMQDYPLDRVEVVMVGSGEQTAAWDAECAARYPFRRVTTVPCNGAHYYELKNAGASAAVGDIVAFTDSDVIPRRSWLRGIADNIGAGADVSLGPTLFGRAGAYDPDSLLMRMTSAVTWGWVYGKPRPDGLPAARGFMDHNVAMRAEVARDFRYRTEFGRIVASPLLFRSLKNAGKEIRISPDQQAVHAFWWRYWTIGLMFRYGHEVYRLRRLDGDYPDRWLVKTGILEPVLTLFWHVSLDVPKWFRLNRTLGRPAAMSVLALPAFLLVSFAARFSEMMGMYATLLSFERTRLWAEKV